MSNLVPAEIIENRIFFIRGQKVMLDYDLAILYGVRTKALNQAVKRNLRRFPKDFMFQLTEEEALLFVQAVAFRSRSQFVTLKRGHNIKYLPYAFTEHGIAMLSSVLNSNKAIDVNIAIMRTFIKLRRLLSENKALAEKVSRLERKYAKHDIEMQAVFKVLKQMMLPPKKTRPKIGFKTG